MGEGTITATKLLPITGFEYGPQQMVEGKEPKITVGPLRCQGQKKLDLNNDDINCQKLFYSGHTKSGTYILKDHSSEEPGLHFAIWKTMDWRLKFNHCRDLMDHQDCQVCME